MDIYKLKFTRLQRAVFRLLCIRAGSYLNQRQIAKVLKVSPTAVAKALKGLHELVAIKKQSNIILVGLNREKAISMKRIENLGLIYESGLQAFLEEKFPGSAVILFGSYSLGEDVVKSDIDIAVIGSSQKQIDLANFEKLLERPVILQFYGKFSDIDKNLKASILNGIALSGRVEL